MKHLHLLMVVITIGLFLYQTGLIFAGGQVTQSRTFKIASHIIYLLLAGSGLYLMWQLWQVSGAQHWAVVKIMLLAVAVSANIKALRAPLLSQKKAGMVIAGIAYVGILVLAVTKPML